MRLRAIYAALTVAALIIALMYIKALWIHAASPNLINPESAREVINIVEVKKLAKMLNESLTHVNETKLSLMSSFLNAARLAYMMGARPPTSISALIGMVGEYISPGIASVIMSSISLINVSSIINIKPLLALNTSSVVKAVIAQYINITLGSSASQLMSLLTNVAGAEPTSLTINLTRDTAPVGSSIGVYGRLTLSNGTGLPGEEILIAVNYVPVAAALTNASGYYSANITIPYIYSNEITVEALFLPLSGELIGSVAEAKLRLMYNETKVTVHVSNRTVTWGDSLVLWGNVTGPAGRLIIINASGLALNATTGPGGFFNVTIPTALLKPGPTNITLVVKPYLSYGPASYMISVNVTGVKPEVTVNATALFAGFTAEILVAVKPWMRPIPLTISLQSVKETIIANEPTVKVPVKIPITQGSGLITLNVTVGPSPPVMEVSVPVKVIVINVLQLALVASAVPAIVIGARAIAGRRRAKAAMASKVGGEALVKVIEGVTPPARLNDANVKAIVAALTTAISVVSSRTGVKYTGIETLREYLSRVAKVAGDDTVEPLRGLVAIAEEALYSPRLPTEDDVRRALEYLNRVVNG